MKVLLSASLRQPVSICHALALMAIPGMAIAASLLSPPTLPESAFADTEVETNLVFDAGTALDKKWRLSIELDASTGNCVEVAFGTDADGDGALGTDEGGFSVAWDCGEWILRDRVGSVIRRAAGGGGSRRMDLTLYLDGNRRARRMASETIPGEAEATFFNPAWDMARIVRRGVIPANEHVESRVTRDALAVIIR